MSEIFLLKIFNYRIRQKTTKDWIERAMKVSKQLKSHEQKELASDSKK